MANLGVQATLARYSTETLNEMYCYMYYLRLKKLPKSRQYNRKTLILLLTKEQVNETVYPQSVL